MANVVSVNISERKGEQKHPVPEIQLKFRHGIVGDAHAGDAIKKAVGKCVMPTEGIFAVVVREGVVRPGDEIEILEAEA